MFGEIFRIDRKTAVAVRAQYKESVFIQKRFLRADMKKHTPFRDKMQPITVVSVVCRNELFFGRKPLETVVTYVDIRCSRKIIYDGYVVFFRVQDTVSFP